MSILNNPKTKERIKSSLEEISNAMTRIESERDFIKEITINICEEFNLSKKTFRKLARTYHKRNFSIEVTEHEEFKDMYEQLTNETSLNVS